MSYAKGSGNYKSSYIRAIIATADQTETAETTMQDHTVLKITLKPNTTYSGHLLLRIISPAAADINYTIKAITGTSFASFAAETASPNTSVAFGTEGAIATSGSEQSTLVYFYVATTTGGILQFQFAQETSNGGNTIIKAGSTLVIYEG